MNQGKSLGVAIGPRLPEDLKPLVNIAGQVRELDGYPSYLPDDDFHRFLTRPEPVGAWVAVVEGRVVGHVALNSESHAGVMAVIREAGIDDEVGVVARLLVDPAVRRLGMGGRLLEQATAEAVAQGQVPVLDVVVSAGPAIRLYRASGWQELGRCEFAMPGLAPIEEIVFARLL
ncbi:MAG TPA: GNAT family N-acetyltransferase [Acidimicrobiales bacterium]|nr:GNAT family N-acetyltransferase [Acidimicrobiales bacterium]